MSISLAFYNDAGLTSLPSQLNVALANDGTGVADRVVYLGSPVAGRQFQVAANPGTAAIVVSLADSNAGAGAQAAHVKLAASSGALASAVAGASLSLAATLFSGAGAAVPIYVRVDTPAMADGIYTDLSLTTNPLIEGAA